MPIIFGTGSAGGGGNDTAIQDLAIFGEYSWANNHDATLIKLCADPHAMNSLIINRYLGDYALENGLHIGNMIAKCNRIDLGINWAAVGTAADLSTVDGALDAFLDNTSARTMFSSISFADISSMSWGNIATLASSGMLDAPLGATKDIVANSETLTLELVGYNHDAPNSATFVMKNLMATTRRMEATNINTNSWNGSEMRGWVTGTFIPSLPSDFRESLKEVDKMTSAGNQSDSIVTTKDKAFLLSEVEFYGGIAQSKAGEGAQYDYYKEQGITISNYAALIKKLSNGTGAANAYWQRSPDASSATNFCIVYSTGSPNYNTASNAYGVCLGFVIG